MKTILEKDGKKITVTVDGRFTTDETAAFLKDIEPIMEEKNAEVVMELGALDFISSAGIRCFVMLLKACKANDSRRTLRHLTPQLTDIFTLTALLDKFNVE